MSYDEYRAWASEDTQAEWVDGEVIELVRPSWRHQQIVSFLHFLLKFVASAWNIGEVIDSPVEMRLREGRSYREPDVLFVATEHLDRIDDQRLNGPADLAVEVVSDDSAARDRLEKFFEYATSGVREYWIFDPRPGKLELMAYTLTSEGYYQAIELDDHGRLCSLVMPGFWINPSWLAADPLPNALAAAMEIVPDRMDRIHRSTEE